MKKHDLFDRFRQEAEELTARPSARAWRDLEDRLDARRRRHRVSLYRSLGMVASVLALVVMLTLLALVLDRLEDRRLATLPVEDLPKELHDLTPPDEGPRAVQVMEYRRAYQQQTRAIQEGGPEKRLVPTGQGRPL